MHNVTFINPAVYYIELPSLACLVGGRGLGQVVISPLLLHSIRSTIQGAPTLRRQRPWTNRHFSIASS
jgi:hypothetical protein